MHVNSITAILRGKEVELLDVFNGTVLDYLEF